MKKILTFVIPAYNAERYLECCLNSLLVEPLLDKIEVIVVNDGSTDATKEIALKYQQNYPNVIRLINKTNGGHGSAINVASAVAEGLFFKVIDADDWILSDQLEELLSHIERLPDTVDAILTNFHCVHMETGERTPYEIKAETSGEIVDLHQLLVRYKELSPCCSFHGIFYRTETYQASGIMLSEKVFYEDTEYVLLPFSYVRKILLLPVFFYQYQIGNMEQSVSFQNQVKRISHMEVVIKKMMAFYRQHGNQFDEDLSEFFQIRIAAAVVSYYAIALVKNPNKKEGRKQASCMQKYVEREMPAIVSRVEKKRKAMLLMNKLHISAEWYKLFQQSSAYQRFRCWWSK